MEWNDSPASTAFNIDYLRQVYTTARLFELQTGLRVRYALMVVLVRRQPGRAVAVTMDLRAPAPPELAVERESLDTRVAFECAPRGRGGGFLHFDGRCLAGATVAPREWVARCSAEVISPTSSGFHLGASMLRVMMPASRAWWQFAGAAPDDLSRLPRAADEMCTLDQQGELVNTVAPPPNAMNMRDTVLQAIAQRLRQGWAYWYAVTQNGQPLTVGARPAARNEGWDFLDDANLRPGGGWRDVVLMRPALVGYDPQNPVATTTGGLRLARVLIAGAVRAQNTPGPRCAPRVSRKI